MYEAAFKNIDDTLWKDANRVARKGSATVHKIIAVKLAQIRE